MEQHLADVRIVESEKSNAIESFSIEEEQGIVERTRWEGEKGKVLGMVDGQTISVAQFELHSQPDTWNLYTVII